MSDHPFIPKSNSKIVPPFIPKPKESLEAENARLKAEVEELTHDANEADQQYEHAISRVRRLEAEVERLRKAGDAMAVMVGHIEITGDAHRMMLELSKDWNAAKEGKQP